MNNQIKSNYIIIGSGLAGLYAAYHASKYGTVSLLTKHSLQTSSTFWAQGGIASAIGEEDSPELHFEDTIRAGRGLCNEDAVKILVNEGPERINELISDGLSFDKTGNSYELGLEGGHTRRRILHLGGNETGKFIVEFLINKIKASEKIKIYENYLVHNLVIEQSKCSGCLAYKWEAREDYSFLANVIIIASGGGSGIYSRSTNPHSSTGDGITLAYNSGVEVVNMEFVQFHPTAFHSKNGDAFLISEAVRGEGAYLVNEQGYRFMKDYHASAELAPRDIVSKGIFDFLEKEKTDHVFLSLLHLDKAKIKSRFRNIYDAMLKFNIDITSDLIPVSPAAHYMIGGINTDLNGNAILSGLYACGEAAHSGVHGANRLASNSLLECLVFSHRAVEDSKEYLSKKNIEGLPPQKYFVNDEVETLYLNLKKSIQRIMNDNVGIVRSEETLKKALELIYDLEKDWEYKSNEYYSGRLRSLKTIASLIISGAIAREETRGSQIRIDFPNESERAYNINQSIRTGIETKYL